MAKKTPAKPAKSEPLFRVGDRVHIAHWGPAQVVTLRGPLGPKGVQIYRVCYSTWPDRAYMEVMEEQLRLLERPESPGFVDAGYGP